MNLAVKGFAPDALVDRWLGLAGQRARAGKPRKRAVIMADGKLVAAADLDLPTGDAGAGTTRSTSRPCEAADRKAIRHSRRAARRQHFQHRAAARHQPAHAL
jgi:two-component system NtrC family response regulator